jgi:hypothetical protein
MEGLNETEMLTRMITGCIDFIYDKEEIFYAKDVSTDELTDFIDSLTGEQFAKIQEFFDTIPKMKKDLQFKCSKCGYQEELVLEGIQSFFG